MTKWQKIPLGVACLLAGGALLLSNGAALADSLIAAHTGVPLVSLFGVVGGLFGIGGACDLLGPPKKPAKPKTAIAESRFASRADIEAAGLAGQRHE